MGEHDRNANPNPLQVQQHQEETAATAGSVQDTLVDDNPNVKKYVHIPHNILIRKGQQRVSIFIPKQRHPEDYSSNISYNSYQIVVHNGEAYLINLDISSLLDNNFQENRQLLDFSSGWHHSLVLFENNTSK